MVLLHPSSQPSEQQQPETHESTSGIFGKIAHIKQMIAGLLRGHDRRKQPRVRPGVEREHGPMVETVIGMVDGPNKKWTIEIGHFGDEKQQPRDITEVETLERRL